MPDAYQQLLEATIQHLEVLQARGVRFVSVSPQSLTGLDRSSRPRDGRTTLMPNRQGPPSSEKQTGRTSPVSAPVASSNLLSEPAVAGSPPAPNAAPSLAALTPEAKAAAFADL